LYKSINLVLAVVAVALCLLVGALLHSWLLLGLSLGIAVGAFLLNKKLEHRYISQAYKDTTRPASRRITQYEEIHAPDFFN
jgi:hypothetical protein